MQSKDSAKISEKKKEFTEKTCEGEEISVK